MKHWPPPLERFVEKVQFPADVVRGCWNWTGGRKKAGYGQFAVSGKKVIAHRLSFQHFVGVPVSFDYEVDHVCRNKSCVNPSHLEPVTLKENRRRRDAERTACNRGHQYTDSTRTYTDKRGYTTRLCADCEKLRRRRRA